MTKLIAQLKLQSTPKQHDALLPTLEMANAACNVISQSPWDTLTFKQFDLHRQSYEHIRSTFPLVVRCIAKVADAYKIYKGGRRAFKNMEPSPTTTGS